MTEPTIIATEIGKSFTTGAITQTVIRTCSLRIHPGELTLVVGPSGSGKSTMLSMLSGLLRPDTGRVLALEEDLWSLAEAEVDRFRLRRCGFIFQGFNLFGALTARENVMIPLQYLGIHGEEALALADAALDEVGLRHRGHLRPMALSGGEKQRVAIARALAKRPRLLFADEPTSALDSRNGEIVVDLLKRIAREHGATVLGVTHDPRLLSHADRVIRLEDGDIASDDRPSAASPPRREEPSPRPPRASSSPPAAVLLATLLLALLLPGCFAGEPGAEAPASSAAERLFAASARGRIDIEGGVVKLAAQRDGVIETVRVEEGDRVSAGQMLAALDATLAKQSLALAESEQHEALLRMEPAKVRVKAAEREVRRFEALHARQAVAIQELDKARDERDAAHADLLALRAAHEAAMRKAEVARREVEERVVRAPADGRIIQRQARPGNGVSTLNVTPLFLFAPDAPQIVRADLEERFIPLVHGGQRAEILLEAAPHMRWEATVLRLGRVVGQRPPSDDPMEKQDQRVVECVLSVDAPELLIGQRVIVRFHDAAAMPKAP